MLRNFSRLCQIKPKFSGLLCTSSHLVNQNCSTIIFSRFQSKEALKTQRNADFSHSDPLSKIPREEIPFESSLKLNNKTPEEYRREHNIKVNVNDIPDPLTTLDGFSPTIMKCFKDLNITAPLPVQAQSWPLIKQGRDLVGIAETGCGKTLAFLLPALESLALDRSRTKNPRVLVLCPTRELAKQIYTVADPFCMELRLWVEAMFGGTSKHQNFQTLKRGVDVLIGTPGRIIDLVNGGFLNLSEVKYLVLDEADRMLDMGFEPSVQEICETVPTDRQTLMFSATWCKEVQNIARRYQKTPVILSVGTEGKNVVSSIAHEWEFVKTIQEKDKILLDHLSRGLKTLIFCNTKLQVDRVTELLNTELESARRVANIHGDITQFSREKTLAQFRSSDIHILVATDVCSRGIDVKDIDMVINYDMPQSVSSFVHRAGRAGRAGRKGISLNIFHVLQDRDIAKDLIEVLETSSNEVPKELHHHVKESSGRSRAGTSRYQNSFSSERGRRSDNRFIARYENDGYKTNRNDGFGRSSRSGSFGRSYDLSLSRSKDGFSGRSRDGFSGRSKGGDFDRSNDNNSERGIRRRNSYIDDDY